MNSKFSVQISTDDADLKKDLEILVNEAGDLNILPPDSDERPDIVIFEMTSDYDREFIQIHNLLDSNMAGEVIVTSKIKDSDLLLKVMRAGIKEFLAQPLDRAEVTEALTSLKNRVEQAPVVATPGIEG